MLHILILVLALGPMVNSDSTLPSTKHSSIVTCSKSSDDCNNQISGSVCLLSKGLCICKVGFRMKDNACIKISCSSNAECDPHRYQQGSRSSDTALIDSVCDIVHNQCVCLQGYYESSEGLCQFGNSFDWTIIAINATICCAFSTVVVLIFGFCLWCVFDEPLSKCKRCSKCLGKSGPVCKSEEGPTLKGMMSAKSHVVPRLSDGSVRRPPKKRLNSGASGGGPTNQERSQTQLLKKNKSKSLAKL